MNNTLKELTERKSVRVYTEREITGEEKRQILIASTEAPSAGNQQMYTILDITDEEKKEKLAVLCDNQPFIAKAKMVLIYCADFCKWVDAFAEAGAFPRKPGAGDLLLSVTDACIAAQNAVVAAQSMGIGSCYIGDVLENCGEMRELLCLPAYVVPCAMLVFGYPTEQQRARIKPKRAAIEDIVCENTYHRKTGEELRAMFADKCANRSYEDWMKAFCERKYNSDFSREMTRSVEQYLTQYQRKTEA